MVRPRVQALLKVGALLTVTLVTVVGLAAALRARSADQPGRPGYVSLGDSLATGDQPDDHGHDRPTAAGYVDVLSRLLVRRLPGLRTARFGCGGATTASVIQGDQRCGRAGLPAQLPRAEAFLRAHPGTVLVTVDIGDNDVEPCIGERAVDWACVRRGIAGIDRNLPVIASGLKAAAGPHTAVVGIVDYDQFLSYWLDGRAGRQAARRSLAVIELLNRRMAAIYRRAGVRVADAGARFAIADLRSRRHLPGHGRVPLAVYRTCRWTWACAGRRPLADDHANAAGYRQIADAVLRALPGSYG
jgi:lysophospholipase L1-like esterase